MKRTDAVPGPDASGKKREARRYPRYSVNIRVTVQVRRAGAVQSLWGRSNEMGQDGMSATLTGELEVGEVASLEFTLPATVVATQLRGVVRYRQGFRHGFEFLTISESQRESIEKAVSMMSEE